MFDARHPSTPQTCWNLNTGAVEAASSLAALTSQAAQAQEELKLFGGKEPGHVGNGE